MRSGWLTPGVASILRRPFNPNENLALSWLCPFDDDQMVIDERIALLRDLTFLIQVNGHRNYSSEDSRP